MIVQRAFRLLYPHRDPEEYSFGLKYSKAFSPYNGNVRYRQWKREYLFRVSHLWEDVDEDIQIGLIQYLMKKCFSFEAEKTHHIDLYDTFMRNIHKASPKTIEDDDLQASFDRVNEQYFDGLMDISSLRWGQHSRRQLGLYEYGHDMITISSLFKDADHWLLDFIMYHELLHKKHKFYKTDSGRNVHHSPAFRRDEKLYDRFEQIEDALGAFIRSKRRAKYSLRNLFN